MTDKINDGGAAFPHKDNKYIHRGLTVRDWFAGKALQGIISRPNYNHVDPFATEQAYEYADAMIKAREL